ncbi:MAG: hypothetical protein H0V30_02630 [Chitinophagaceae bacterium]|nr:hypothetical protein [Chitinophagaceae bacterium]
MIKNFTLVVLATTLLFISGCTNSDQPAEDVQPEEQVVPEPVEKISDVDRLPLWQNYMEQQFPEFTEDQFNATYTVPLETFQPYPVNENEFNFFKPYMAYNTDSTKAIDIYSYSSVISEKGGQRVYINGGPDAQINLVNLEEKTSQRLFFSGPMLSFWDAQWIDSNKVIVAGTEEKTPVYWIIDLNRKSMQLYTMEGKEMDTSISREGFLRRKMPDIIIPD